MDGPAQHFQRHMFWLTLTKGPGGTRALLGSSGDMLTLARINSILIVTDHEHSRWSHRQVELFLHQDADWV